MNKYKELLAHYNEENGKVKKQLLIDHLFEVSRLSKSIGKTVDLENTSELIGLLHDVGKAEGSFQQYLKGEYRGNVNHSSAGAKILIHICNFIINKYNIKDIKIKMLNLYVEILQYAILSHHGLYDLIDKNLEYHTQIRLDYDKNTMYDFNGNMMKFFNFLNQKYKDLNKKSIYTLFYDGFIEFTKIYKRLRKMASMYTEIKNKKKALNFYYGTLVRLLLSILKEADIYDSSNYYSKEKNKIYSKLELKAIWEQMSSFINDLYDKFDKDPDKSKLDIIRTKLAKQIYEFSKKYSRGAYKLNMPVGAGKTYAALRYCVANAKEFNKSKVFYCTAFLSVLEQNAYSIKDVLGDKYVLEHHSNVVEDFQGDESKDDMNSYQVYEYLKESWESPIVLTTTVQLFNTMFKGRSSNIRRFSKLIDSVIVIDEIQSLPTKVIYNFNLMMNFLTNIMNCTIIHCTATQPNYDNKDALEYPCFYGKNPLETNLIKSIQNPEVFYRVDYYSLLGDCLNKVFKTDELINHIKKELKNENSALIVLNTKRAVYNVYNGILSDDEIKKLNYKVIYLTTNLCPQHRLDIIKDMKIKLKKLRAGCKQEKIICISTKLVEAGVDIDFDLVYRSIAGVDSIIQTGGRCNREGKKFLKGKLFIFKYIDEDLRNLPELQKQIRATESALRRENFKDTKIDIEKICQYYFSKLYLNEDAEGRNLEYPLGKEIDDTILNLLTTNPIGKENYELKHKKKAEFTLKQGFKTAARNFNLIENDNSKSVIVHYENSSLLEELDRAIDDNNYYKIKLILKKLQPYTISIMKSAEYERYISRILDGEISILNQEAYDKDIGLFKGELETLVY